MYSNGAIPQNNYVKTFTATKKMDGITIFTSDARTGAVKFFINGNDVTSNISMVTISSQRGILVLNKTINVDDTVHVKPTGGGTTSIFVLDIIVTV